MFYALIRHFYQCFESTSNCYNSHANTALNLYIYIHYTNTLGGAMVKHTPEHRCWDLKYIESILRSACHLV